MKNLLTTPLVLLALLAPLNAGADFNKGFAAREAFEAFDDAAIEITKDLAAEGEEYSQYLLGEQYYFGGGVLQDYKEAAKWLTLSAEQGNVFAHYLLGIMYENGEGVIQDYVYAHMWWNIAASNGSEDAQTNRDIIAKQMTQAQIAEAQKLARECVAKDYKGC